jgi:hypothetical protein
MFLFYVLYFYVWPGMVPNQRQLSIVVSDWEPYLGGLFSHYVLWVVLFCVCVYHTVLFRVIHSLCCFWSFSVLFILLNIMNTYHAAPWSSPSSTNDSRYSLCKHSLFYSEVTFQVLIASNPITDSWCSIILPPLTNGYLYFISYHSFDHLNK